MVSVEKIAANRKNALRSTGPRTARGKSKSKLNAVTLGIHAKSCILPGENESVYCAVESKLYQHFSPVGPIEETLVCEIIHVAWRLKRMERADFALFKQIRDAQVARYLRFLTDNELAYVDSKFKNDIDDQLRRRRRQAKADLKVNPDEVRCGDAPDLDTKRDIDAELASALDLDNTILTGLVPKSEGAPQAYLDRERRATVRAYCSLVDKLMKLQEYRTTVTVMSAPHVNEYVQPTSVGRLKSLTVEEAAIQNREGLGVEMRKE